MAEPATHLNTLPMLDNKRRKGEAEGVQVKAERGRGVAADKAKANYVRLST